MSINLRILLITSIAVLVSGASIVVLVANITQQNFETNTKDRFALASELVNQSIDQLLNDLKDGLQAVGSDHNSLQDVLSALSVSKVRRRNFYNNFYSYYDFAVKNNINQISLHYRNLTRNDWKIYANILKDQNAVYSYSPKSNQNGNKPFLLSRDEFGLVSVKSKDANPIINKPSEIKKIGVDFIIYDGKPYFDLMMSLRNESIGAEKKIDDALIYQGLEYGKVRAFAPLTKNFIEELEERSSVKLNFFKSNGVPIAGDFEKKIDPQILSKTHSFFQISTNVSQYLAMSFAFNTQFQLPGYIVIAVDKDILTGQLREIKNKLTLAILISCMAIIALIFLFMKRYIISPIKRLGIFVEKVSDGELNISINSKQKDEIGRLTNSFNKMTSELKIAFETIEEQNENLENRIKERTAELAKKNQEIEKMFDNLDQGIFIIDQHGKIEPRYSKFTESIYEVETLKDQNAYNLLFDNTKLTAEEKSQAWTTIDSSMGEDILCYLPNEHLLPGLIVKESLNKKQKSLETSWVPIIDEETGNIENLMIIQRDITDVIALQKDASLIKEKLEILAQLVEVEPVKFEVFHKDSENMLKDIEKLAIDGEASPHATALVMRHLHTIKGSARMLGFKKISEACHTVETDLEEFKDSDSSLILKVKELNVSDRIREHLSIYKRINDVDLSREKNHSGDYKIVDIAEIEKLIHSLDDTHYKDESELRKVVSQSRLGLSLLLYCDLDSFLKDSIQGLDTMAAKIGKPKPNVNLQSNGILIKPSSSDFLFGVISHILTNMIDHGIEDENKRKELGKNPEGTINISLAKHNGNVYLTFSDDGNGLNLEKIASTAEKKSILKDASKCTPEEIAECIFKPNFSTASSTTELSGRGVGMEAVRTILEDHSCKIRLKLSLESAQDLKHVPFSLEILLTNKMYLIS